MHARPGKKIHFEKVPLEEARSLVLRHTRRPFYRFDWHYHPEVELALVERGEGVRFVGDSIEPFSRGDLCLLGANLPHTRHSQPTAGGVHSIVIQFLPLAWGETFLALPENRALRRLLQKAARGLRITGAARQQAADMIQSLARRKPSPAAALPALLEILAQLAGSHECVPLSSADFRLDSRQLTGGRLTTVFQAIEASHGRSQEDMAAMIGMSPQSFSRFFKRQVGKTYVDYVNERRINRACRGLLETNDSILSVAAEAGFANLSHFNRRFLRARGMTPSQFRRLAR